MSGSNWLFFGDASDDEQGSKKGDDRRGEFHRMTLARFCCEPRKKSKIRAICRDLPPTLKAERADPLSGDTGARIWGHRQNLFQIVR
jgi:hypothetical protein